MDVMARSETELQQAIARQKRIVEAARQEILALEAELMVMGGSVKFDEAFFWGHLVPLLFDKDEGLSSSEIFSALTKGGFNVSREGLRVFIHRSKNRGRLVQLPLAGGNSRWRISDQVYHLAMRLGQGGPQEESGN